jgi:ATP-binding protein involved in chromosome partitioning
LSLAQKVPVSGAVIVTTPQDVALLDVIKAVNMFKKVNIPVLGIIENMSYLECPHCQGRVEIFKHGGGRRASEQQGVPFLGEISLNSDIPIGSDMGVPIVKSHPDSPQAKQFMEIARAIAAKLSTLNYEKSMLRIIN